MNFFYLRNHWRAYREPAWMENLSVFQRLGVFILFLSAVPFFTVALLMACLALLSNPNITLIIILAAFACLFIKK